MVAVPVGPLRYGVHAFRLDQRGLACVFGELEAAIMETVWALGEASVADVCHQLPGPANYKTVMTVMNRLVDKRFLTRRRVRRAYAYAPVESRDAFAQRISRRVAEGLVLEFGASAVTEFVAALDAAGPELFGTLRDLVAERGNGGGSAGA
jgi:predicted transcriptional regulator